MTGNFPLLRYLYSRLSGYSNFRRDPKDIALVKIPKLEEIFSTLENPYCCWGTLDNLSYRDLEIDDIKCGTLKEPDIDKLRSLSKPAPFGKGCETVLDESVRKAFEISGDRIKTDFFALNDKIPLPYPNQMLGKEVLYKLHMYEAPGGKFEMHRDTPHGKDHLGTFIVCLPTKFEGGELVVHSSNGEETRLGCQYDKNGNVQAWWAFFFTDCRHSVEPVTSGSRLVLQYDFFASQETEIQSVEVVDEDYLCHKLENHDYDEHGPLSLETTGMENGKLVDVIPNSQRHLTLDSSIKSQVKCAKLNHHQSEDFVKVLKIFVEKKKNLGIVLSHMYPTFGPMEARLLRGRDRLLYNCIMELQEQLPHFKIIFRYLINEQQQADEPSDKFITKAFILDLDEVKKEAKEKSKEFTADLADLDSCEEIENCNDEPFYPFDGSNLIVAHHPGGYFTEVLNQAGIEYTGNESMPGRVTYAACVLIVEFFKPEIAK